MPLELKIANLSWGIADCLEFVLTAAVELTGPSHINVSAKTHGMKSASKFASGVHLSSLCWRGIRR